MRRALAVVAGAAMALASCSATAQAPRVVAYDAQGQAKACDEGLERARKLVSEIAAKATPEGIFEDWNRLFLEIESTNNQAWLYSAVHPDKAVRAAAEACVQKFNQLNTEINQDERLFARLDAAKPADPRLAKLRRDLLRDFEDAGVSLPAEKRARARELIDAIEKHRIDFVRNMRDDPAKVTFTAEEMAGLPEAYLKARKPDASGNYVLGFDQPSYAPFMQNAKSGAAREKYYRFRSRQGGEANLALMERQFALRHELAALYGRPSFAHHALRRKMAQTPEAVDRFLEEVRVAIDEAEKRDLDELRKAKAAELGTALAQTRLQPWDTAYYIERLRRERHSVDQEKLRAYFPADKSVDFMLLLATRMYGLRFTEGEARGWHPDLRYFEVHDPQGRYLANFYVDLFPREGKRSGAFAAPLRAASRLAGRTPSAALVCNFNRQGFNATELSTLLHEFGHVLNLLLSNVDYAPQSFSTVKWDFVEAPSQMFEEWSRRAQTLALFKEVCPQCPLLSPAEVRRLDEARRFAQSVGYSRQWLLASFDMEMSRRPRPPLAAWKEIESKLPLGFVEGSMHPASFQHIVSGYGAGYYGYMWSLVIARDLLSQFEHDMLDPKVAARYREAILGAGNEREEAEMVRRFLGRDPKPEAFFRYISGK
ncbi:MAG TPA: M3 family metallopeptidase [Usitatibacter sp.]|nr:M3 family metallopeptidase [Usitatibacter sp.]